MTIPVKVENLIDTPKNTTGCMESTYPWFHSIKPGFHYPSSITAGVHGPSWRPVNSGAFLTPVNSGRQLGCQQMHKSSRAVNLARELGPWTRVVETGL